MASATEMTTDEKTLAKPGEPVAIPTHTQQRAMSTAKALLVAAACAAALSPPAAQAADTANAAKARPKDRPAAGWTRTLNVRLTPRRLNLPADASPRRLARAALKRHARRLGLGPSLPGVRFTRERNLPVGPEGAARLRSLRFQQTIGGVRVVWSQIDVSVSAGKVLSISATVVPAGSRRAGGERRVSRKLALAIARRAVRGRERTLSPQLVAYAGKPTTRRARRREPRLAYVVEAVPAGELSKHSPTPVCVVVDAQTGKVIATWAGHAARPQRDGADVRAAGAKPRARAAATTTLMNVYDAKNEGPGPRGTLYAQWSTTGDPFSRSGFPDEPFFRAGYSDPSMDAVTFHSRNVMKHLCGGHFGVPFCGRDGGYSGTWLAFGVTGRVLNGTGYAFEHVVVNQRDSDVDDAIAHEFGHHVDKTFAGDRISDGREVEELEEAIADMFAYDFDRNDTTLAEDRQGEPSRDWARPGSLRLRGSPYPALMSEYKCGVGEEFPHYNSTILSHAYYRFVQKPGVGHGRAGKVLRAATYDLSPRPTFVEVKDRFIARSAEIFIPAVAPQIAAAARQAFVDEVGIGRVDPCPTRRVQVPGPVFPPTERPTSE